MQILVLVLGQQRIFRHQESPRDFSVTSDMISLLNSVVSPVIVENTIKYANNLITCSGLAEVLQSYGEARKSSFTSDVTASVNSITAPMSMGSITLVSEHSQSPASCYDCREVIMSINEPFESEC